MMKRWLLLGSMVSLLSLPFACGGSGGTGGGSKGTGGASSSTSATTGAAGSVGAGGDIGIDGGGVGGSAMMDGDACGSVALTAHITPGNIVVVFDQSDSMKKPFTDPSGNQLGPKWKVAEDALVAAVQPIEGLLDLGTIFFPTKATGNTCSKVDLIDTPPQIPITPGPAFITAFQDHFSAPGWTLILGTPLKVALDNADLALPDPSPLTGARAVVVITDGAPTCDTNQANILAPVIAMAGRSIKTYVVGLPGSAAASTLLDKIAMAGGTGQYLTPADPMALQAALSQIATNTIDQCTIALDPPPADPTQVYLFVTEPPSPDPKLVPEVASGDGWSISPDGKTATLHGEVCDKAKNGTYTAIQFVYGCPTPPPPQ
ncbi:MAG: vWA domain-containing protein [Byssovorax sp.]